VCQNGSPDSGPPDICNIRTTIVFRFHSRLLVSWEAQGVLSKIHRQEKASQTTRHGQVVGW
jgi:hypothetical protein